MEKETASSVKSKIKKNKKEAKEKGKKRKEKEIWTSSESDFVDELKNKRSKKWKSIEIGCEHFEFIGIS